jgi:ComF family protein
MAFDSLAAFAFPQRCPTCGVPSSAARLLCGACRTAIPSVPYALCARCLVRGREPVGCRAHPDFTVHAAWLFDEPARAFVHALKFAARPRLALAAAPALAAALPAPRFDLIAAVPLHSLRQRARGYNQAAALADALAAALGVPYAPGLIERVRPTGRQVGRGAALRRAGLRGAFRLPRPAAARGRSVLIVDDVMTTGATLDACLGELAGAGARARGLVLAWAQ